MNLNLLIAITILCWGIWGIFDKKALDKAPAWDVLVMLYVFYIVQIPFLILALNYLVPGWHLTGELVFWTGLAGFTYTAATLSYLTAMEKSEASYVLGITAAYPLVLQFLAALILNEAIITTRLVGASLIGLGIVAISSSKSAQHKEMMPRDRAVMAVCIITATVGWGIWGIFDKKALAVAPPIEVFFTQCLWDFLWLIVLLAVFYARGHRFEMRNTCAWKYTGLSALSLTIGAWTYLYSLASATASYVVVITGCYPLFMYIFAMLFLREKFNRIRLSGIALVVLGGVLVQFTQGL